MTYGGQIAIIPLIPPVYSRLEVLHVFKFFDRSVMRSYNMTWIVCNTDACQTEESHRKLMSYTLMRPLI
jgi:hypothetical protein